MAHIEKYKAHSVGHMLAHYRRDQSSLERDNIDPTRTKNNLVVAHYKNEDGKLVVGRVRVRDGEPNWETVQRRIARVNERAASEGKRATRKDAVVMADVVVTLPENVRKGDEDRFFRLTYWYLSNKLGRENMMGGYVHKDECRTKKVKDEVTGETRTVKLDEPVRDHMHVPFTPILDGRFNYKKMCPRSFYKNMHKELGDYLEKRLGYRPEVELGEDKKAEKVLSQVPTKELDAARAAIIEPAEAEAARIVADARAQADALVSAAEKRRDELVTQVADGEEKLAKVTASVKEETDRLELLRQANDICEEHVEELEAIAADVRGYEDADRSGKLSILARVAADCDGLRVRIYDKLDNLKLLVARAAAKLEFWRRSRREPDWYDLATERDEMVLGGFELGYGRDEPDFKDDDRVL